VTVASATLPRRPAALRPVALVFLPFAAGYYLSYLFRTINALIATRLMADLGLKAADLGVLTSVFFLSFAVIQLPLGMMLDRYGPRRVQTALLPIAALGAAVFALADNFVVLVIARALIGVGVAGSLMSGLKAIVLWFPRERIPLANGCFIMLGALGAVTATAPAESLLESIGWRDLFEALAALSAACALLIYLFVPDTALRKCVLKKPQELGSLRSVYADARFWRLAPLSATCIGSAWALHGLWAAPWLRDVAGLDQPAIVQHLFVMAIVACGGALFLGFGADRFGHGRGRTETILAVAAVLFIAAQMALALDWPIPTALTWAIVAGVGAATVLSFAILAEHFPAEIAGRANAALNLLHVGGAFVLQSGIGIIIEQWTPEGGRYPTVAYQTAFAFIIALQIAALFWFIRPRRGVHVVFTREIEKAGSDPRMQAGYSLGFHKTACASVDPLVKARAEALRWRRVAFGAGALSMGLAIILVVSAGHAGAMLHAPAVERFAPADAPPQTERYVQASDPQIAYALSRFIEDVRSLSTDPIVVRSRWARAFRMVTDQGAQELNAFASDTGRLTRIGEQAVIAEVTSILRASEDSFKALWIERIYERGALARTERYRGVITISRKSASLDKEPLGFHVDRIEVSQEGD
jgi:type IV secretory pathway TrbF-like protein/predicted MFS family arabinose efflux permease